MDNNDTELRKATEEICKDRRFSIRRHTNWEDPDEFLESEFGKVKFITWAMMEKERIERKGGRVTIWEHPYENKICLTLDHMLVLVSGNYANGRRIINPVNW
jgi:hypothetical protein